MLLQVDSVRKRSASKDWCAQWQCKDAL